MWLILYLRSLRIKRGSSLQNISSNFSKDNLIKNDNDVLLWFSRKNYY